MSRSNCPNCGAPYLTLGIRCDYCGTQKKFNETESRDYTVIYADCKPMAVIMDPEPIREFVTTMMNGKPVTYRIN